LRRVKEGTEVFQRDFTQGRSSLAHHSNKNDGPSAGTAAYADGM